MPKLRHSCIASLTMVVVATALGPMPGQSPRLYVPNQTEIEALTDTSDLVIVGEILQVLECEQAPPKMPISSWPSPVIRIAQIQIGQVLYGSLVPGTKISVVLRPSCVLPDIKRLHVLLFLRRDAFIWVWASEESVSRIKRLAGTRTIWEADPTGIIPLDDQLRILGAPQTEGREPESIPNMEVVARIVGHRIRETTPTLVLSRVSGAWPWEMTVNRDGSWTSRGEGGILSEASLRAILKSIEDGHLADIPQTVGRSLHPGDPFLGFVWRSDRGVTRSAVYYRGLHSSDWRWREALEALWSIIPGDNKPSIVWKVEDR